MTALSRKLIITTTLLPRAGVNVTLGTPVILSSDTLEGGGAGTFMSFSTPTAVAAALAASQIVSTTATNLNAALGQEFAPASVVVCTYGAGAPADALDILIATGSVDVGIIYLQTVTETVLETFAAWWTASAQRRARYFWAVQSADTGLYGGTFPASLDLLTAFDCCRLFYSDDAQPTACAWMGLASGINMAQGPQGAFDRLLSVTVPTLTESQQTNLLANNVSYMDKLDDGSGASERVAMGITAPSGKDLSAQLRLMYAARSIRTVEKALLLRQATLGRPIQRNLGGISQVEAPAEGVMKALADVGYWTPTAAYPTGYLVEGEVSGNDITLNVYCVVAGEVETITIPITGEEV